MTKPVVNDAEVEATYNKILNALDTGDGTANNLVIMLSCILLLSRIALLKENGFKSSEEAKTWIRNVLDVSFDVHGADKADINSLPN